MSDKEAFEAGSKVVGEWNRNHEIGTAVSYRTDRTSAYTVTTTCAYLTSENEPVVKLEGLDFWCLLADCQPHSKKPKLTMQELIAEIERRRIKILEHIECSSMNHPLDEVVCELEDIQQWVKERQA